MVKPFQTQASINWLITSFCLGNFRTSLRVNTQFLNFRSQSVHFGTIICRKHKTSIDLPPNNGSRSAYSLKILTLQIDTFIFYRYRHMMFAGIYRPRADSILSGDLFKTSRFHGKENMTALISQPFEEITRTDKVIDNHIMGDMHKNLYN